MARGSGYFSATMPNFINLVLLLLGLSFCLRGALGLQKLEDYHVSYELIPGLLDVSDKSLIPEMYAGHIPLDEDDTEGKNYFFWKFHDTSGISSSSASDTLIIWLNGGPGCSSMDGALMESGPLRIDRDGKAYLNEGSWHTRGDMVFVDQPAGTGFSITGNTRHDEDLKQVSEHFLLFLKNYYKVFPDDLSKKLILAGESYAGQYIPFIADALLMHNVKENSDIYFNLKGLLIGNGWIDPDQQSLSYIPFAFDNGIISKEAEYFKELTRAQEICQNLINDGSTKDRFSSSECESILNKILFFSRKQEDDNGNKVPKNEQCYNMYDYRLRDSYPSCGMNWPEDLPNISKFFSTPGVMDSLHLDVSKVPAWRECDSGVSKHLKNKNMQPSIHLFTDLLEEVEILLFNGDKDIICNNYGVENLISGLSWDNHQGFTEESETYDWQHLDQRENTTIPAGVLRNEGNLLFLSIYNASHMVPFDKPIVSRGVIDIYLKNVELIKSDGKNVLISKDYEDKETTPGNENDDDTFPDDQKPDTAGGTKVGTHLSTVVFALVVSSLVGLFIYYNVRGNLRHHIRTILIDPENRPPTTAKSVSWADDLASDYDVESGQSLNDPNSTGKSKTKKGYSIVPDAEDSFELDEL